MEKHILKILAADFSPELKSNLDTNNLAERLSLSRNRTSSYLNDLVKDGQLVKINSRPVTFFNRQILEGFFKTRLSQTEFKTSSELKSEIQSNRKDPFHEVIGYATSLENTIFQCKAAVSYSQNGLPIMLVGESGTGKTFLAEKIYEYTKFEQHISESSPFVHINCSEYANNPDLFLANLFGAAKGAYTGAYKETTGIIEEADGGYLFLDEIHCLSASCQEKLFQFMDLQKYHKLGDNQTWYTKSVRFLFATTEYPSTKFLTTFLRRIPVILDVPTLAERSNSEKLELIAFLLKVEEKKLNKNIKISNQMIEYLISTTFTGNVGELKNTIRLAIAKQNFMSDNKQLAIDLTQVFNSEPLPPIFDHRENIIFKSPDDLVHSFHSHSSLSLLIKEIEEISKSVDLNDQKQLIGLLRKIWNTFELFYSTSVKQRLFDNTNWKHYAFKLMKKQFTELNEGYYTFSKEEENFSRLIDVLYVILHEDTGVLKTAGMPLAANLFTKSEVFLNRQFNLVNSLTEQLNYPDKALASLVKLCLLSYIEIYAISSTENQYIGLIMAHGNAVATEIANTTNQLLNSYIFDSINLPLDTNSKEALLFLEKWLKSKRNSETIVIMSDMGSLTRISERLAEVHSNLMLINSINPPLALTVGNDLLQKASLNTIEKNAIKVGSDFRTNVIKKSSKQHCIICSSASGKETNQKIQHILEKSLPDDKRLIIKSIDFDELTVTGLPRTFLDNYEVKFIIGTLDPNISNIPFISIGDLIANNSLSFLSYVLADIFNQDELHLLSKNLLSEFALTNLVNELTILNPQKLLSLVTSALDDIQKTLKFTVPISTFFGLYIHTCCMIERLIRAQDENLNDVIDEENFDYTFYNNFKIAFARIESFYSVTISKEEVSYIKNYIYSD